MGNWRYAKCDEADELLDHSRRCSKIKPADYQCCVLCNEPFGNSLRYLLESGEGWAHWHCIMNQKQKAV